MPRLIWVFAGRICHFVGFAIRRLKCAALLKGLKSILLFVFIISCLSLTTPVFGIHTLVSFKRNTKLKLLCMLPTITWSYKSSQNVDKKFQMEKNLEGLTGIFLPIPRIVLFTFVLKGILLYTYCLSSPQTYSSVQGCSRKKGGLWWHFYVTPPPMKFNYCLGPPPRRST